ncbi:MAG: hypothetical protein AAFX86_15905 [Pseudomonadota bacterium]
MQIIKTLGVGVSAFLFATAAANADCRDFFDFSEYKIDYTELEGSPEPGRTRIFDFRITSRSVEDNCTIITAKWEQWQVNGRACRRGFRFTAEKAGEGRIRGSGKCAGDFFNGEMRYVARPVFYRVSIY